MGIITNLAIFFVMWWIILFTVLPINIKSQWESDQPDDDADPGAPQNPQIIRKFIMTTIVTAIVFVLFRIALALGWFDFMIGL